jgi:predicted phosphodiesterase
MVRTVLLAVLGALLALGLWGKTTAVVGPFDATLSVHPSLGGDTMVRLAPLGRINLDTHDAPVRLELRVDELRLEDAERFARDPSLLEDVGDDLAGDVRDAVRALVLRCVLAAAIGGLAGALLSRARWDHAVAGVAAGTLVVAAVGGLSAATFDTDALAEPRYSGLLTVAPTAVGDVQQIVENFDRYRVQLAELVGNVASLYQAGQGLPAVDGGGDTIDVLHVSDIHLNPQAFDLMRELIKPFDVDAIVDTGDITDWGSEPEAQLVAQIATLQVPYVWVRGNHDSMQTQAAVAAQPNAVVLDGDGADVAGLRFWGIGDPRYTPNKDQPVGADVEQEAAEAFAPQLLERFESTPGSADTDAILVHDARAAADVGGGKVPLVLSGHTHRAREGRIGRTTRLLVEGSTGGAGLRGLQQDAPVPLTCSLLHFDRATGELVAYDQVTVRGLGKTGVTIERHLTRPLIATTTTTTTTTG